MTLKILKICLISSLVSCVTPPGLKDVKIYKADSIREAIVRDQDEDIIYAWEQRFDDYYAISGDDLGKIYDACINNKSKD